MTIVSREVFETYGLQFDSAEKARRYRADLIGQYLDAMPVVLHPRDRIAIADFIAIHRANLRKLLDY